MPSGSFSPRVGHDAEPAWKSKGLSAGMFRAAALVCALRTDLESAALHRPAYYADNSRLSAATLEHVSENGGNQGFLQDRIQVEPALWLLLLKLLGLCAQTLLLLSKFRSELFTEVLRFEDRADFQNGILACRVRTALRPLDRLFH